MIVICFLHNENTIFLPNKAVLQVGSALLLLLKHFASWWSQIGTIIYSKCMIEIERKIEWIIILTSSTQTARNNDGYKR